MKPTTRFWVFLILGLLFLIPTLFFVVGLALVASYGEGYISAPGAGLIFGVCTLGLGLPALLFFWLMFQESRALRTSAPIALPPPPPAPPARTAFCRRCGGKAEPILGTNEWRCASCGNVQTLG